MCMNGPGQFAEWLETTVSGPVTPVAEISDGMVCHLQVEILESQLQLVSFGCLQVLAAELFQPLLLAAAEVPRVLQPQVAAPFQLGVPFLLLPADLVQGFVDQPDGVITVESALGAGEGLSQSFPESGGQIQANLPKVLDLSVVGSQVCFECLDGAGVLPFGGKEHPACLAVHEEGDVAVTAAGGGTTATWETWEKSSLFRASST